MRKKKKRIIRFDKIFTFLFVIFILIFIINTMLNIKISNIYISGNNYLSNQEIIEIAKIENYPSTLKNFSSKIKQRLENNSYIKEAKVTKKWFKEVYIKVTENRPLFYYASSNKTILLDGTSTDKIFSVPTVLNYITDSYYNQFITKMGNIDLEILKRISEIKFLPNDVDDNRFLLTMTDGNYVYVDIDTFDKINKYLSILESLPDKNGILYLDYGNNFEIIE